MEYESTIPEKSYIAMDLSTILTRSINYWVRGLRFYWPIFFAYQLAITGVVFFAVHGSGFEFWVKTIAGTLFANLQIPNVNSPVPFGVLSIAFIVMLIVFFVVNLIIQILLQGMVVQHTADYHAGLYPTLNESFFEARSRIWSLIGATFLITFLILGVTLGIGFVVVWMLLFSIILLAMGPLGLLSSMAVLIVGTLMMLVIIIYISTRLAVVIPAIILEDAGAADSIFRSWKLVSGNWWRTFGVTFVIGIISMVISIPASLTSSYLIMFFGGSQANVDYWFYLGIPPPWFFSAAYVVVFAVLSGFTAPLSISTSTMIYHDLRGREPRRKKYFA